MKTSLITRGVAHFLCTWPLFVYLPSRDVKSGLYTVSQHAGSIGPAKTQAKLEGDYLKGVCLASYYLIATK